MITDYVKHINLFLFLKLIDWTRLTLFLKTDFQNAFLFMASSAQLAEKNQHHPDWRNLYNTVDVVLTTDDQACLSTFDFELAQGMDLIYSNF